MFDYHYEATRDGDGWLIAFPDFTGVNTDADTEGEVPQRARDALLTMLEHFMRTRTELPAPTFDGSTLVVALGEIVDLKLMLYQGMVWNGVTQAELAKRLGTSPTLVNRLLDLDHVSKAEQIRAAMDAIGVRPMIRFDPKSSMPLRARRVGAGFIFADAGRAPRSKQPPVSRVRRSRV